MPIHKISDFDSIFYLHQPASKPGLPTFVFFNPLTGDTNNWEAVIAPRLREKGFGTLSFDYRGQTRSTFSPTACLTSQGIVNDAVALLASVKPENPIFVGLSIGGLYAAQAWLAGAVADKLVLINTLRNESPRLKWINDALVRAVEIGGLQLFRDLFLPLLMNEDWLAANRDNFLTTPVAYEPLSPNSGSYKLLAEAGSSANWNLSYEHLTLPTLVVTGLQDHVFLENDVVNTLFNRIPNGKRLDLENAGHLIPGERPETLIQILSDFK
ncbi:MAG: alpha/beta hydrolase [Pseudomonadota bacterium]